MGPWLCRACLCVSQPCIWSTLPPFLGDSGKVEHGPLTDTLMPHVRVSRLEQGVNTSTCHSFLQPRCSALGEHVGGSAARKPGRAQSYSPGCSAVPVGAPPPGREQGPCKRKFAPAPSPGPGSLMNLQLCFLLTRKGRGWMGVGTGPASPRGDARCILVNCFTEIFCSCVLYALRGLGVGVLSGHHISG